MHIREIYACAFLLFIQLFITEVGHKVHKAQSCSWGLESSDSSRTRVPILMDSDSTRDRHDLDSTRTRQNVDSLQL